MTLPYALCIYSVTFIIFAIFFCKKLYLDRVSEYYGLTLFSGVCAGMLTGVTILMYNTPALLFVFLGIALMFGIVYIVDYFVNGKG